MQTKRIHVDLDLASSTPLTLQLVEGLKAAIRDGRLLPGDPVPSTRPFAEGLGISRNTVLDAYSELSAEGLLVGRRGSGSFIADPLPTGFTTLGKGAQREALAFRLPKPGLGENLPPSVFACRTGQMDPRMVPALALARAYRRAMEARATANPRRRDFIRQGHLKACVADMLVKTAGIAGSPENLLLVSGFDAALQLVAAALLEPGDVVAVEGLGSKRQWSILRQAGAVLEPVEVDGNGLSVASLARLGARKPVRAVLVSPRCQYPTTVGLARERREDLLQWAQAQGVAILECDAESGIQLETTAPPPLAAQDTGGSVVYIGVFTKTLSPSLPLAYIQGPKPLITHLAASPLHQDQGADPVFEGVITDFFLEGEFHRHLARLRTTLLRRRDALIGSLERHLGSRVAFTVPAMGMALWITVASDLDVDLWAERAVKNGVAFSPGRRYHFDGTSLQALRLGFASHTEEELDEIVRRMAQAT